MKSEVIRIPGELVPVVKRMISKFRDERSKRAKDLAVQLEQEELVA